MERTRIQCFVHFFHLSLPVCTVHLFLPLSLGNSYLLVPITYLAFILSL